MTKRIDPIYLENRSSENAYGCACVCNVQMDNHEDGQTDGISSGLCGCACNGQHQNRSANRGLGIDWA